MLHNASKVLLRVRENKTQEITLHLAWATSIIYDMQIMAGGWIVVAAPRGTPVSDIPSGPEEALTDDAADEERSFWLESKIAKLARFSSKIWPRRCAARVGVKWHNLQYDIITF